MEEPSDKFRYVYSSSLGHGVQIKVGTLEGRLERPAYELILAEPTLKHSGMNQEGAVRPDLQVECRLWDGARPLSLPVCTAYRPFSTRWNWNEWLTLPVHFADLPRSAHLALTVYDCAGPARRAPVGGTAVPLFSKRGLFRQGLLDLRVWPRRPAHPADTPGKPRRGGGGGGGAEQMPRLAKLAKRHRNGHLGKVDWLDRLTFREIELINEREKRESDCLYLMVEFPRLYLDDVHHHVVYFEQNGDEVLAFRAQADVVNLPDHEILKENFVESKHHKLARSLRGGHCDRDAKPTAAIRDALHTIVSYPPTKVLSNEEQDRVWKFRFYLSAQKKALTKFLKCVNWTQPNEVDQALAMMDIWVPMDVEDALELLSPTFTHPAVRRYAIMRLQQTTDEEILLYLLQLVQALKYENFKAIEAGYARVVAGRGEAAVDEREPCLEKKESKDSNSTITNENTMVQSLTANQPDVGEAADVARPPPEGQQAVVYTDSANTDTLQSYLDEKESVYDLASFLIQRAKRNMCLANYLYWYLLIECEDQEHTIKQDVMVRNMYLTVMKTFLQTLSNGSAEMQHRRKILSKQQRFIDKLVKLVKAVSSENGNRKKKTEKMLQLLADPDAFKFNFAGFDPIPFPLDPEVTIRGIVPDKASLFKSAYMPAKLHFLTTDNKEYVAIFKNGDDLRQDQLILQMITLMDKLLRKENLDLKLTPYRVLATSTKHGFVQFVESVTVAEALASDVTIQNYFRKFYPQEGAPYGIAPDVMSNYVRSCAGYCVITYLLGVGDRHLDNLLLTPGGRLFHIDFGYILGRDPKPLPPPMKLSKEMVEAMGGMSSDHYQEFRRQCYTAFLHLRRHANLILNLFSLMVDASVPDIALEPDKTVRKVQDKFRLDLGEEEAVRYIQNLIDSSVTAVMAAIVEHIHRYTQYFRK